jgi:hypothetical protein
LTSLNGLDLSYVFWIRLAQRKDMPHRMVTMRMRSWLACPRASSSLPLLIEHSYAQTHRQGPFDRWWRGSFLRVSLRF